MQPKRSYRKLRLQLSDEDRQQVHALLRKGSMPAREFIRIVILKLLDKGESATQIGNLLDVSPTTVRSIAWRYLQGGLDNVIHDRFDTLSP